MAQQSGSEDSGEIRRKAMVRLVIAGVVTAAALTALWWLDHSGKPEKKAAAKTPTPIVSAPSPMVTPAPAATPEQNNAQTPPVEPPPPPEVAAPTEPSAPEKKPPAPAPAKVPGTGTPPASATAALPAAAVPAKPLPVPPSAYVVRLGVFTDPANAKELVERLNKAGVHAHMETRVQVGPFADRAEAEKARAEIARLGVKGVIATK